VVEAISTSAKETTRRRIAGLKMQNKLCTTDFVTFITADARGLRSPPQNCPLKVRGARGVMKELVDTGHCPDEIGATRHTLNQR